MIFVIIMIFHDFHDFFMKNQKFPKSPKFFAFYLESSKNVLALITSGNERNTSQMCPRSHPSVLRTFLLHISRSTRYAVELQNPAHMFTGDTADPSVPNYRVSSAVGARASSRLEATDFSIRGFTVNVASA